MLDDELPRDRLSLHSHRMRPRRNGEAPILPRSSNDRVQPFAEWLPIKGSQPHCAVCYGHKEVRQNTHRHCDLLRGHFVSSWATTANLELKPCPTALRVCPSKHSHYPSTLDETKRNISSLASTVSDGCLDQLNCTAPKSVATEAFLSVGTMRQSLSETNLSKAPVCFCSLAECSKSKCS